VSSKCGYACSDHASANRAGFQSTFPAESTFEDSSEVIHTQGDVISDTLISFSHMLEHAKMVVGFAYELAMVKDL